MTEEQVIYKQDGLLDDASILYPDFPPLPDFPCMSSSSSSSLTPAAVKAITRSSSSSSSASSSCSAASWAVLKSDAEEEDVDKKNHQGTPPALSSNASMNITQAAAADMDVMENFGFMDLLDDSTDLFDLASIFNQDETPLQEVVMKSNNGDSNEDGASDDLAMVFLEWLKSNKETVSAEDLRRVKIKKSTIECAAKRLGGGKEAMKQLLKLILEWVQTNHLQKRHMKEPVSNNLPYQQYYQDPFQNPNPNLNLNCKPIPPPCFAQSSWIGQPSYIPDPATVVTGFPPAFGYMGDSFANGTSNINRLLETLHACI